MSSLTLHSRGSHFPPADVFITLKGELHQNWLWVVMLLIFLSCSTLVWHDGQSLLLQNNNLKINFASLLLFPFKKKSLILKCDTLPRFLLFILNTSHFGCLLFSLFNLIPAYLPFLLSLTFSPYISSPNRPPLLPDPGGICPLSHTLPPCRGSDRHAEALLLPVQ